MNGGDAVDYVGVSQDKIGLVIGKGGDTIKSINQVIYSKPVPANRLLIYELL